MKKLIIPVVCLLFSAILMAQEDNNLTKKDTTKLDEITLVSRRNLSNHRQEKTLSSIDNYLEKTNTITMIKRGNYAWEASMNNMTSDRLALTISGMQIFGACTDKMDPITSYVDVSNLENVSIGSGQSGTENGHCVGGGIDLQLPSSTFNNHGLKGNIDLGYETNGNYKTTGLDMEYTSNAFFLNLDGIYRKSYNYKAGGNNEVLYSQFEKYNMSLQSGYKLNANQSLNAHIIYDKATNIGYPALTMDVLLAKALITSLSHNYKSKTSFIKNLESKIYFNTITHIMDDSKRPDVPIRMDMPGWSDTYGFYSKATIKEHKHQMLFNVNGFYNRSLAEMTMYPNNPNEPEMFMYTWPDIRTFYTGMFFKDDFVINTFETISTSVRLGFHKNTIAKQVGLESLQIFYPEIDADKNRFLSSFSSNYQIKKNMLEFSFGVGYGERAPTVSEGYGFFLFNSFDNFDYIGNPTLKTEKAIEANFKINYHKNDFHIGATSSYFHLMNYIIGAIDASLSPMTIGANGVKTYRTLNHATIFDVYLNASYQLSKPFSINTTLGYNYGKGSNKEPLPFIKPISYMAELNYNIPNFNASIQLEGNGNQSHYSSFYGEDETPPFTILNLNFGNLFYIKNHKTVIKYGVENVLDANYSTYADWNNIPRQGRNFYLNISYSFP